MNFEKNVTVEKIYLKQNTYTKYILKCVSKIYNKITSKHNNFYFKIEKQKLS